MLTYFFKRMAALLPILLVVSLVIFSIIHMIPGNPAASLLGIEATQEEINALNERLGLNRPLVVQYFDWIKNVLQGNLGDSIFMRQSVSSAIAEHFFPSLSLAVFAQLIAIALAIPMGILAAYRRGKFTDTLLSSFSLLGIAVPGFLLALFLMLLFSVHLRWLPVAGYRALSAGFFTHLRYLILPAVSLGVAQAALITRMTRSAMLDVLNLDYIKTARAKGATEQRVLLRHALKNASIPILTVIAHSFASLVTGAVVVESLFNIPGIGQLVINAITRRDLPVIQGVVLFITVLYVLINLATDIIYALINPRIRIDFQ